MMQRIMPCRLQRIALAIVLTLVGGQWSSASAFKPEIVWVACVDVTTSVPKDHFLVMRRDMVARLVLARLNAREEVHICQIDSDPERHVNIMRLSKPSGMLSEIAAMFEYTQTLKRPDEGAKPRTTRTQQASEMTTNIAGVLAYTKRNSEKIQAERQRLAASGKTLPPAPLWVANIITDGKPEGPQTKLPPGPWPAEVQVWFWGVESLHEAALHKWATQDMGLPEGQLNIIRFTDWENVANRIYGAQFGRPHPRQEVLTRLGLGDTVARSAGMK